MVVFLKQTYVSITGNKTLNKQLSAYEPDNQRKWNSDDKSKNVERVEHQIQAQEFANCGVHIRQFGTVGLGQAWAKRLNWKLKIRKNYAKQLLR